MIEDLLGEIDWPICAVVIAIALAITISVTWGHHDQQATQRAVVEACRSYHQEQTIPECVRDTRGALAEDPEKDEG